MVNLVVLQPVLSLSLLEKYLLRTGWTVTDHTDASTGIVMSWAERDIFFETLKYCKPTFYYPGYNRDGDLRHNLSVLARLEGRSDEEMESVVRKILEEPLPGFTCRRCGRCCREAPDAFRGLLSVEEVIAWERAGLDRILKLVHREERKGLVRYWGWWHPKKGEFFKRCPWLEKSNGQHSCRIHSVRPLKCIGFPLFEDHAHRIGCRGMDEPLQAGDQVQIPPDSYFVGGKRKNSNNPQG